MRVSLLSQMYAALKLFLSLTLLLGLIYPLILTLVAQMFFPEEAMGSVVMKEGKKIGSRLIAQEFKQQKYFWPRPSAVDFDPLKPSGGSNLGPISVSLSERVKERMKAFSSLPPAELVYASASGLDPHITWNSAYFQLDRIAQARSIAKETLLEWMEKRREREAIVNVLELNLALDETFSVHP